MAPIKVTMDLPRKATHLAAWWQWGQEVLLPWYPLFSARRERFAGPGPRGGGPGRGPRIRWHPGGGGRPCWPERGPGGGLRPRRRLSAAGRGLGPRLLVRGSE